MKLKSILISLLIFSMLVFAMGIGGCTNCPKQFNPPCGTVEDGELSPTMVGGPVPEACGCPEGSYDSGEVDRITAGGPYKICLCN